MVEQQCPLDGVEIINIKPIHAIQAGNQILHHKDPFDPMIVAQASIENLTVVTSDPMFEKYGISVLF
ncbi:MAG: PIN domain-containing protein [Cyanobacteria bacterium P01_A01_bin.68]